MFITFLLYDIVYVYVCMRACLCARVHTCVYVFVCVCVWHIRIYGMYMSRNIPNVCFTLKNCILDFIITEKLIPYIANRSR